MDKLRAQLHQHQRAHRYRTLTRFVTWAAAGALAVAAGGIMAGGVLPRLLGDESTPPSSVDDVRVQPGAHSSNGASQSARAVQALPPAARSPGTVAEGSVQGAQADMSPLEKSTAERSARSGVTPPSSAASQSAPTPRAVSLSELVEEERDRAHVISQPRRK